MRKFFDVLLSYRLRALIQKEFRQLRRDPRATASLIVAPILQLLIFGSVLVVTVSNLPLGIVDESNTPESRELVAALTESKSFRFAGYYDSVNQVGAAIEQGALDAGVVIPFDFSRSLWRGRPTTVQFLLNATNANTATIGEGYGRGVLAAYNSELASAGFRPEFSTTATTDLTRQGQAVLAPAFLYNPGLVGAWFTVTGVLGILLILNGSILASMTLVKEREAGTIEQLLISPASAGEIITAKIVPLFGLLSAMALFAMGIIRFVFKVPFHGSMFVVFGGAIMCLLSGISIGMFLATFAATARQAQLAIFFLNPPLTSLSGAFTPIEAMPRWLQPLTLLDPMRYYGDIARGALIKGSGLATLWPDLAALLCFAAVMMTLSIWRYRKQLA